MNTFCFVIQKYINKTSNIYLYEPDECLSRNHYKFLENIYKNERVEDEAYILWSVRHSFYTYITKYQKHSLETKYEYLDRMLNNLFYSPEHKTRFLEYFSKMQRTYAALSRFAFLYKYSRAKTQIVSDLYMNPIDKTDRHVIVVLQNNNKYLFSKSDLIKIMNNSLTNTYQLFSEPVAIKNPHTNVPFNKSTLYNIYFFIREHSIRIPPIIQAYFLSNFHLANFRDMNQSLIRQYNIKQLPETEPTKRRLADIRKMLDQLGKKKRITIDSSFPNQKLFEIMRPYLHLYYSIVYSTDLTTRYNSETRLRIKLNQFYNYNPQFGRKVITVSRQSGLTEKSHVTHNMDHVPFYKRENIKLYGSTHLEAVEDEYNNEDFYDDEDEDDGEEAEAQFI